MDNLLEKQFANWANNYFEGKKDQFTPLNEALRNFRDKTGCITWNQSYFKEQVKKWCKTNNYVLNPEETSPSMRNRVYDDLDYGVEMLVIKTTNS